MTAVVMVVQTDASTVENSVARWADYLAALMGASWAVRWAARMVDSWAGRWVARTVAPDTSKQSKTI